MALPTLQNNSSSNVLDAVKTISGLSDIFAGKKTTTSGGSQTSQTLLSQDAVNSLLQQILQSNSGLAAISSGQKGAGLYNSSVNTLLTNDLLSRTAGEVAKASAPTVTSRAPQTTFQQPQISPMTGLLGTGALMLGNKVLQKTGVNKKVDDAIQGVWDKIFPSDSSASIISATGDAIPGVSAINPVVDYSAGITSSVLSPLADTAALGLDQIDALGAASNIFGSAVDSSATSGYDFFNGYSGAESAADFVGPPSDLAASSTLADVGTDAAAGGVPILGPVMNLAQGDVGGATGNVAGFYIGNALLPGVGGVVGSVLGGIVGDDSCFITTAAVGIMGLADDCYELQTLRTYRDGWLKEKYPKDVETYYTEAPEIVKKLAARADAEVIFRSFYQDYISYAVEAIQDGAYETAYTIYRNMFNLAKKLAED